MFKNILRPFVISLQKVHFSSSHSRNYKCAILGAAGGIGQPLSLLLKQSPLIDTLNMYDIAKHIPGVTLDVAHIETCSAANAFMGCDQLAEAVCGMDVIVIPGGMPRKPGMSRDDLFNSNASIIRELAEVTSKTTPNAFLLIITNPINSTVPIACEIYKKNGVKNVNRIIGVTTLDICRANRFLGELKHIDPAKVDVPVICGHSGDTIIPVLSQCKPKVSINESEAAKLTKKIQDAGTEVVKAKAGTGSATLSMAYAAARLTLSILRGLNGECVVECGYIQSNVCSEVDYFSTPLRFGKTGIEQNLGIPKLNDFEMSLLKKALPELKKNIEKGKKFAGGSK